MHRPLKSIEKAIRQQLSETAAAETEQEAARAFQQLQRNLEAFIQRANQMNREHWKLRDTALKQATTIAQNDLDGIGYGRMGEAAPSQTSIQLSQPGILSVEKAPECLFVRLSFGLVNILQVALLDVPARQLYLQGGICRNLVPKDVRTLIYHLKLYQAK